MNRLRLVYVCTLALAVIVAGYALLRPSTDAKGDGGADVLAVVNGRKITRREVDARAGAQLQELESKLYQTRKGALNNLVGEMLLEEEARKQGLTVEDLKRRLAKDGPPVTDAQVEAVYAAQAKRFENVPEAQAKEQIRATLENRARAGSYEKLIAEVKARGGVEILLPQPAPVRVNVRTDGPSKGSPDAPLVLVEFSDFECPACKGAAAQLKRWVAEHGDEVRVVYRHLPLPMHKGAFGAAQAAFCAGEQEKFWEMHDLLFEQATDLSADALKGYAARLGLDAGSFGKCMESDESKAAVTRDLEEARAAGIRATPSFVLNGKLIPNPRSLAEFKEVIELELQAVNSGR